MKPVELLYEDLQDKAGEILKTARSNLKYNESSRQIQLLGIPKEFCSYYANALMVMEGAASGSMVGWRQMPAIEAGDDAALAATSSGDRYAILLPAQPHMLSSEQMDTVLRRLSHYGLYEPNGRFEPGRRV